MVKNTKTGISWERNVIFLRNKKILNLCLRWLILRSYRFVAEVTFKNGNFLCSFEYRWENTSHGRKVKTANYFEILFLRRNNILLRSTVWARSLIRILRRYVVRNLFFTSRLEKYCTFTLILKMVWKNNY